MLASSNIDVREGYSSAWIDSILEIHNRTEMKRTDRNLVNAAFLNSYCVVTVWQAGRLLGCGRLISDGMMYSAIFDVVVDPDFQKQGLGKLIMLNLISKVSSTCIHLTSTFGNEDFYAKLGFKKHKTAMALYPERMQNSPYLFESVGKSLEEWNPAAEINIATE